MTAALPGVIPMYGSSGAEGAAAPDSPAAVAAKHGKLLDAAEQFEAMFLQQLLKGSGAGSGEDGETRGSGDDEGGGSEDSSYAGFAAEFASKAIAKAGGLGIARSVVAGVEHAAAKGVAADNMSGKNIGASLKSSQKAPIQHLGGRS